MATSKNGPGAASPGFLSASGPEFKPVAHEVKKRSRDYEAKQKDLFKEYNSLSRVIRIINRAEKGPLAGKPYLGCFNGELYPDEVDGDDTETWLQPGTYMDVPKEVAFHLCGNLWDPTLPDKQSIISRHGGPQFQPPAGGAVSGRGAPMLIIGPPDLPDLIVMEINARGGKAGEPKYMYDLYTRGLMGSTSEEALDEEPETVATTVR